MIFSGQGLGAQPAQEGDLAQARTWSCYRINKVIIELIDKMKALKERAKQEKEQPPATVADALARQFGPHGAGIPALTEYRKQRNYADQLNSELAAKDCTVVDLDADLSGP